MALKFIETKKRKKFTRRELLIGFTALLAIVVNFVFPVKMVGESAWVTFFLFLVFPLLVVIFVIKEPLAKFGISKGDLKKGVIYSLVLIIIFALAEYYLVYRSNFRNQFLISPDLIQNFWMFLGFSLFISLPIHFFWEFFFRGFIQLGFEKKIGLYAIPAQAILQTLAYPRNSWLLLALIFSSALGAGFIVRQSRSIFYSFLAMWIIAVSLDIMIIRIVHLGIT